MKLSCDQQSLSRGLAVVGRAAAIRSVVPVLSNVMLRTDEGRLRLAATNLETGISCWVQAKVEEEGATTVLAHVLTDLVRTLPPERVDTELTPNTHNLNLRCGRFESNIMGIDADEFPLLPAFEDGGALEIDADVLTQMIDHVAFAARKDAAHAVAYPVLSGVLMRLGSDPTCELTMAAADGYRLSVRHELVSLAKQPTSRGDEQWSMIVPARTLSELVRIVKRTEVRGGLGGLVGLARTEGRNQIIFRHEDADGYLIEVVSQLIEGNFPDYTQIIPATYTIRTVAETETLLKAVRMADIFASGETGAIRLSIVPGSKLTPAYMSVAAVAAELGDCVGEIDVDVEEAGSQGGETTSASSVEPMTISLNARYLIDILSRIGTAKVALEMTTPSSALVVRPVEGPDLIHIIMPISRPDVREET